MRLGASYNKSLNTGLASKPPIHFSTSAAGQPVKQIVNQSDPYKTEVRLRTNYVLIDFENVQPENLDVFSADHFKVIVFVGASQTKVPFDVAIARPC